MCSYKSNRIGTKSYIHNIFIKRPRSKVHWSPARSDGPDHPHRIPANRTGRRAARVTTGRKPYFRIRRRQPPSPSPHSAGRAGPGHLVLPRRRIEGLLNRRRWFSRQSCAVSVVPRYTQERVSDSSVQTLRSSFSLTPSASALLPQSPQAGQAYMDSHVQEAAQEGYPC